MKLPSWLPGLRRKSADNATLELFKQIYGARLSNAGITVTLEDAIRCAAVFACARVIATGIAQVPLKLFRELPDGGRQPAKDHPLYRVVHRKPNAWQTSYELRETLGLHLALAGRAYCYKVRLGGQVRELIPLEPGRVTTKESPDLGAPVLYTFHGRDGRVLEFPAADVWHLKGPSWCGWEGLDALNTMREAIGLALATESSQAALHRNGVRVPGVYSVEGPLSSAQYNDLRKFLKENHAGENSGLPMIVDRAAKWLPLAMNGVDAQHLETRKHQVVEVCRAMGVLPIMVFESDKATTYASAEAMFEAHKVHTLAPLWERLEQSMDCSLLSPRDERDGLYFKFMGNAMARGSLRDRAEYFSKALGAGGGPAWMVQDEVRVLEELNPMGGAAALLPQPTNVRPAAPADSAAAVE